MSQYKCLHCGDVGNHKILESRNHEGIGSEAIPFTRRNRKCASCGETFSTIEVWSRHSSSYIQSICPDILRSLSKLEKKIGDQGTDGGDISAALTLLRSDILLLFHPPEHHIEEKDRRFYQGQGTTRRKKPSYPIDDDGIPFVGRKPSEPATPLLVYRLVKTNSTQGDAIWGYGGNPADYSHLPGEYEFFWVWQTKQPNWVAKALSKAQTFRSRQKAKKAA